MGRVISDCPRSRRNAARLGVRAFPVNVQRCEGDSTLRDNTWASRAPVPHSDSLKQSTRRPWGALQIGSDSDARTSVPQRVLCDRAPRPHQSEAAPAPTRLNRTLPEAQISRTLKAWKYISRPTLKRSQKIGQTLEAVLIALHRLWRIAGTLQFGYKTIDSFGNRVPGGSLCLSFHLQQFLGGLPPISGFRALADLLAIQPSEGVIRTPLAV